jgi:hypothetical protein
MRRAAAALVLWGCSPSSTAPYMTDPDGGSFVPHGGGPTCGLVSEAFALPSMGPVQGAPLPNLAGPTACSGSSSELDYFLADMNGDARADLVVTRACDDASVGTTQWRVYPNDGVGFAAFVSYPLPSIAVAPCAQIALADVDGDRALDLVVTSLCSDATVGTTRWLVFRNQGGFSTTAQSFALPPNATANAFPSTEVDAPSCGLGHPAYAFFDLTGDGKPDLVETSACDDVSVGITHWRVFPGNGAGVGSPIAFGLPGGGAFASPTAGEMSCVGPITSPRYAVVDIDGDLAPDLVVTSRCADDVTGTGQWLAFTNGKTSFATQPTVLALPSFAGESNGAFESLAGSTACGTGVVAHAFADLDGDLKPDLIVTSACGDPTVGVLDWLVYPGTGSGFAAALAYALPPVLGATAASPVTTLSGSLSCTGAQQPSFAPAHLLDAAEDVVVTATCTDPSVGVLRWIALRASKCPQ